MSVQYPTYSKTSLISSRERLRRSAQSQGANEIAFLGDRVGDTRNSIGTVEHLICDVKGLVNSPSDGMMKLAVEGADQLLSTNIATRRIYAHSGWRKSRDGHFYLHAGGAIGARGLKDSIRVALPPALERFRLPPPPDGEHLKNAVRASLNFLRLGPPSVMFPLYAAIWRAPLGAANFSVHLESETGSFKTAIALLAQQYFGRGFDDQHIPANWGSTANSNEALLFAAKDALILIDDFASGAGQREVKFDSFFTASCPSAASPQTTQPASDSNNARTNFRIVALSSAIKIRSDAVF